MTNQPTLEVSLRLVLPTNREFLEVNRILSCVTKYGWMLVFSSQLDAEEKSTSILCFKLKVGRIERVGPKGSFCWQWRGKLLGVWELDFLEGPLGFLYACIYSIVDIWRSE